jgi:transposase
MLYVRPPTPDETQELERMLRQEIGRVSQRAHMILLSSEHHAVPEIARLFYTSQLTVRFWMRRFDHQGPPGLYDEPRSGRPRKAGETVRDKLKNLVDQDPQGSGYLATFWTVAMLLAALVQQVQVSLSPSTLRNALHQVGLRWRRPRLAMPQKTDPEKAAKQWRLAQAVVEATADTAILYADESRIQLLPLLRAMWGWVGQQLRVPTPGTNDTRMLFGALNIRTGKWDYLVREHMRTEDFLVFLEHLLTIYSGPIVLIVDNYSSHTAKLVQTWLADHTRLKLIYLPTHCSQLNPVEAIWLHLKNRIAANRLYASMKLLLDTVDAFFNEMTPEKALAYAGVEM